MKKSLLFMAATTALLTFTGLAGASPPSGIGVDRGLITQSFDNGSVSSGGVIAAVPTASESAFVKTVLHDDGSSGMKTSPTWVAIPAANTQDQFAALGGSGLHNIVAAAQIKQANAAAIIT